MLKVIYFQITVFYTHKIQFTAQKILIFPFPSLEGLGKDSLPLVLFRLSFFILNNNLGFQCMKCKDFPVKLIKFSPNFPTFFLGASAFPISILRSTRGRWGSEFGDDFTILLTAKPFQGAGDKPGTPNGVTLGFGEPKLPIFTFPRANGCDFPAW